MKLRSHALKEVAVALLLVGACDQPRPKCSVARGDFAATYTLVEMTDGCVPLRGELLSVQAYNPPLSKRDMSPNYDKTTVAIQPASLTDALAAMAESAAPDPADRPYAIGPFGAAEPDGADFCTAPALSPGRVRLAEVPAKTDECGTTPAAPAVDVSYTFSNVRVLVTPAVNGTRLTADLTYQTPSCTARYTVAAVYPAVSCATDPPAPPDMVMSDAGMDAGDLGGAPAVDADAGELADASAEPPIECPAEETPAAPGTADPAKCGVGSGIAPELSVQCDPELLLCVLAEATR